jgi:hypothetical protein
MRPGLHSFALKRDGATTLEFVVVFIGFIAIMFFVMELTLYLFFMASLEKAAQAGVRVAVTSDPVVDIPRTIEPEDEAPYGQSCSVDGACRSFPALACTGEAECTRGNLTRIVDHMRGYNGLIQPNNVTITYTDVGIGFAGGPTVPMVTVTVQGIPFQTGIAGLLLGDIGDVVLPPRSASMTGEDLN